MANNTVYSNIDTFDSRCTWVKSAAFTRTCTIAIKISNTIYVPEGNTFLNLK